jgi:hypothetical protein
MGRFVAAALCRRVDAPRQSGAATFQLSLARAGGLGATVATREFFHAPGSIDKFLFAGEKRMAGGADADSNVSFGRASVINRAARANDIGLLIIGMNVRFHIQKRARNLAAEGQICK